MREYDPEKMIKCEHCQGIEYPENFVALAEYDGLAICSNCQCNYLRTCEFGGEKYLTDKLCLCQQRQLLEETKIKIQVCKICGERYLSNDICPNQKQKEREREEEKKLDLNNFHICSTIDNLCGNQADYTYKDLHLFKESSNKFINENFDYCLEKLLFFSMDKFTVCLDECGQNVIRKRKQKKLGV
jgi:ribosomal protein L32